MYHALRPNYGHFWYLIKISFIFMISAVVTIAYGGIWWNHYRTNTAPDEPFIIEIPSQSADSGYYEAKKISLVEIQKTQEYHSKLFDNGYGLKLEELKNKPLVEEIIETLSVESKRSGNMPYVKSGVDSDEMTIRSRHNRELSSAIKEVKQQPELSVDSQPGKDAENVDSNNPPHNSNGRHRLPEIVLSADEMLLMMFPQAQFIPQEERVIREVPDPRFTDPAVLLSEPYHEGDKDKASGPAADEKSADKHASAGKNGLVLAEIIIKSLPGLLTIVVYGPVNKRQLCLAEWTRRKRRKMSRKG